MSRVNVSLLQIAFDPPLAAFSVLDSDPDQPGCNMVVGEAVVDISSGTYRFEVAKVSSLRNMLPPQYWEKSAEEHSELRNSESEVFDNLSLSKAIHVALTSMARKLAGEASGSARSQ